MSEVRKIIIDCDAGTDDSQAILMALATPQVQVIAITTTFGNSSVENTSNNVLRTLKVVDKLDVPVYKGCSCSLLGAPICTDGFHGWDALGDVPHLYRLNAPVLLQKEHASSALVRLAKENPGEITLVVLGPCTNIAVALQLDAGFGSNLKECLIMGGNTTGKGNITEYAEFNFYSDPEAAFRVLKDLKTKQYIIPCELCEEYSWSWEWYSKYTSVNTDKARFVCETDKAMVKNSTQNFGAKVYWAWDQLCMAATLDPQVVVASRRAEVSVELVDAEKRGMMKVNWDSIKPNVFIVTKVDVSKYEQQMYKAVTD